MQSGRRDAEVFVTLYALVACIRTRVPRRKWLWIVFIVLGVGKLAVDWTIGECRVFPASMQLFSASAFSSPYGPWTVAVSLPVGAIEFLLYRKLRLEPALER
ncbi:MAG: hypothetical protein GC151_16545 [Betaproteobacteria bacterium]|nr:hypothetical protein [Betaproteobacteria bacterium]